MNDCYGLLHERKKQKPGKELFKAAFAQTVHVRRIRFRCPRLLGFTVTPDSVPGLLQRPIAEGHRQELSRNLFPVRVAPRGNDVAKDVGRLLAHAQVAYDEPVIVDVGLDDVLGKPAQAVDRPDTPAFGGQYSIQLSYGRFVLLCYVILARPWAVARQQYSSRRGAS